MKRNSWAARLIYGLALWLAGYMHNELVQNVSNTPAGMLVYHMSAAIMDYALLICASSFLFGRLSETMQTLCMFSMVANFVGWVLYLAYAPPIPYNYAIEALAYAQYAALILVGLYGSDRARDYLFCGHDPIGPKLHHQKAER